MVMDTKQHLAHRNVSGWTVDTYAAHNEAIRAMYEKFEAERDRRYTEVDVEKDKAAKIREEADREALGLAREIQKYKDEKANELREQINKERGFYASKDDLTAAVLKIEETLKPVQEFVASQRGRHGGTDSVWKYIFAVIAAIGVLLGVAGFIGHVPGQVPSGYVLVPANPPQPATR